MFKKAACSFLIFLFSFSILYGRDSSHITLQLKWKHQFQFAGYYAAKLKGFYKEEGLNVDFIEGSQGRNAIEAVLDGKADFGIGDADILLERLNGKPLVLVSPIFQHSPFVILSMKEKGIKQPSDLIGKRLMIASNSLTDLQIKYFLMRQHVPLDSIIVAEHSGNVYSLLEDKADAMTAYSSSDTYFFVKNNIEYNILSARMYGYDFYGDALFTSEKAVNEMPETVEAFRRATLKGWKYALEHKEEIVDSILKMDRVRKRGITREQLLYEADRVGRLIHPQLVEIGHINYDRWQQMALAYVELGLAKNDAALAGFFYHPENPIIPSKIFKLIITLSIIAILLVIGAIIWIRYLRVIVNKKTAELSREVAEKEQAEKKYKLLFDRNPLPLLITDIETEHILEVNAAATDFFGYSADEFLQLAFDDLKAPVNKKKLWESLTEGAKDLKASFLRYQKKDKTIIDAEVISHNINYADKEAKLSLFIDVTEKIKHEEAIKERDERLNLAMQASGISVWNWYLENDYVNLDRYFPLVFGFDSENLEQHYNAILEKINPDDREILRSRISSAIRNGSEFSAEVKVAGNNGNLRIVIIRGKAFIGANGKTYRLTGVCWDGTKQKLTENRIRKLNRLYSLISHVNQTIVRVRDREELLRDLCKVIVKSGRYKTAWISLFSQNTSELELMAAEGSGHDFAIRNNQKFSADFKKRFLSSEYVHAKGEHFLCNDIERDCICDWKDEALQEKFKSFACFPLYSGDDIVGALYLFSGESGLFDREEIAPLNEVAEDISFALYAIEKDIQRVRTEERLRTFSYIVDQSPVLILITNTSGTIEYANSKFTQVTGFSLEDVIGKKPSILKSGKIPFETYSDLWKTITSGHDWQGEFYNKKKNGDSYWALSYITPIYDNNNVITNYLSISEDVTERREIEKQLVVAKENAEKSDLLKTEFLAQMSHEIRTPINAILSFTSLIKEELSEKINEELKSSFGILDRAGNRIIRTIDLILHMSELQTGSYEFNPKIFDLYSDVLLKLFVQYKKSAGDKNLEFKLQKEIENALVYADEHKVSEIFNNLIDNAIKYTSAGRVTIYLGKNGQDKIYVRVEDTGIGMSEEFLSNLFKPFVQEEQGYTRRFEGNGLGLALVKKYCDLNQAEIEVKSLKGEGSSFIITFSN